MNPTQDKNIQAFNAMSQQQGTGQQYVLGKGLVPVDTTLSATDIGAVTPLKAPPPVNSTIGAGIIEGATTTNTAMTTQAQDAQTRSDELAKEQNGVKTKLTKVFGDIGSQGERTQQLEEEAGLADKKQQYDEITNQIESTSLSYRRQIENLDKTFTGTTEGKNDAIRKIERESARELADLSIIQNARSRNYSTAKSIVDRKVELETEDLKSTKDALMFYYDENKEQMNKEDERFYAAAVKKADREYQEKRENTKALEDLKTKYREAAIALGKNNDVLLNIQRATTPEDILKVVAANNIETLEDRVKRAQIDKIYSDMALSKDEFAQKVKEKAGTSVIDPLTGKPTSELKISARTSAQELLNKVISGTGTIAIGKSRLTGLQYIPGTSQADFQVQFDNLKSLLSLENIKLLKGQGQVSDAERKLLADASSKINLSQSEKEFKSALSDVYIGLGGQKTVTLVDSSGQSQQVTIDADGLQKAKDDGLTIIY